MEVEFTVCKLVKKKKRLRPHAVVSGTILVNILLLKFYLILVLPILLLILLLQKDLPVNWMKWMCGYV